MYRKIRWETSIDGSGTAYRTMVCYKESNADASIDPDPTVWTGSWRDARFSPPADGGRPENALTGTLFGVAAVANDAIPLHVPEADGKMRFWRDTPVASLATGTEATLGDRVVGYEFDEEIDNGSRPPGLIRMSSTTTDTLGMVVGDNIYRGQDVYPPGTATHVVTLYKHASSGALVFGAGTVQWSWGLDGVHDNGGSTPDTSMGQATVNLLADMGVQPATLQAGLLPALASLDGQSPVSDIVSPAPGAALPNGFPVTITGSATDSTPGVVGGVEVSVDGGVSWHPASGRETWSYTFTPTVVGSYTIRTRAVDDSGNIETPGAGRTIVIEPDNVAPTVSSTSPPADATGVAAGSNVTVTFSEAVNPATVNGTTFRLTRASGPAPAVVTWNAATLTATLDSTGGLAYGDTYTVTVKGPGGVSDLAGNQMALDYVFSFTAEASPAAPPAPEGPGGPVLVITSLANPFSRYYEEILRAEGLNAFKAIDISTLDARATSPCTTSPFSVRCSSPRPRRRCCPTGSPTAAIWSPCVPTGSSRACSASSTRRARCPRRTCRSTRGRHPGGASSARRCSSTARPTGTRSRGRRRPRSRSPRCIPTRRRPRRTRP